VSDVDKPVCPWCRARSSRVVRSKGATVGEAYRRRRQCLQCGGRFPTIELPDVERFRRELVVLGYDPGVFGL
jgi:transcriptional repressor NrdR